MRLYMQAGDGGHADSERSRILEVSARKFSAAHSTLEKSIEFSLNFRSDENTTCSVVLHRWAQAHTLLAKIGSLKDRKKENFKKAFHLFEKAKTFWPDYRPGLIDYQKSLIECINTACDDHETRELLSLKESVESALSKLPQPIHAH